MAVNWFKVVKAVGTTCSFVSLICSAVSQSHEINDAATKAVAKVLNKN